jgi:toxin ParE1/3/4
MSNWAIQLHPEAVAEAKAARAWYRERSVSAADAFVGELDHAIEKIVESPRRWTIYVHGTRRFLLQRFPYAVVY